MRLIHRCQRGFTTVTMMGVLMVGGLLVAASFAAVDPDIGLTAKDEDGKQAYAAAEAGLNYYINRLGQDNGYYLKCTNVPQPNGAGSSPVNQRWTTGTTDPRTFLAIPGFTAKYAIELMPAPGYTACVENTQQSMVNQATGSFRIRSTGVANRAKRSIVATLRRKTFIDYIYFTDFETLPPATYSTQTLRNWAADNCVNYRGLRHEDCEDITFPDFDVIAGPLHTNDSILVCGSPDFGRNANDKIELNQASPGWEDCNSGGTPNFIGTVDYPAGILPMPTSNAELANAADYTFSGETTIVLNGTSMTVTSGGTTQSLPLPPDGGVVYVNNATCASGYQRKNMLPSGLGTSAPANPGGATALGCGNVYVRGNYSYDLTIGAANDIIVTEDVQRASGAASALLGLVANNFVRVYHPVNGWSNNDTECDNNGGPGSITIHASILAVNQSFITDNWYCGDDLGTLTVNGSIAQRFRGTVGRYSGDEPVNGYEKAYTYNDNLRFREPPHFINPTESAWQIIRQNEQVPAR
jgi:hypothetical protein